MKKKIVSLALVSSMAVMSITPSFAVSDISEHWAEPAINKLIEENVINGYEDDTFRPENKITREEVAQLIYKYFNKLIVSKDEVVSLNDISGRWSEKAITELSKAGIVKGYPDGSFSPEKEVTRAEFATMVLSALENSNKYEDKQISAELGDISEHWAGNNIEKLVSMGLIKGYPNGTFAPENTTTRAEVASVLNSANISIEERNGSEENPNKEEYAVKFVAGDRGSISGSSDVKVKKSEKISKVPNVQAKSGYTFEGWIVEGANEVISTETLKNISINKDLTVEASILTQYDLNTDLSYISSNPLESLPRLTEDLNKIFGKNNNIVSKTTGDGIVYDYGVINYKDPNTGITKELVRLDSGAYMESENVEKLNKLSKELEEIYKRVEANPALGITIIGELMSKASEIATIVESFYTVELSESKNFEAVAIRIIENKNNVILPDTIEGLPLMK